jgi:hypothetical protein
VPSARRAVMPEIKTRRPRASIIVACLVEHNAQMRARITLGLARGIPKFTKTSKGK